MNRLFTVKDLQPLAKQIVALMTRFLGLKEGPAVCIAFTVPPDHKTVHWITNVTRQDGVDQDGS